jgi:hypothetical protein
MIASRCRSLRALTLATIIKAGSPGITISNGRGRGNPRLLHFVRNERVRRLHVSAESRSAGSAVRKLAAKEDGHSNRHRICQDPSGRGVPCRAAGPSRHRQGAFRRPQPCRSAGLHCGGSRSHRVADPGVPDGAKPAPPGAVKRVLTFASAPNHSVNWAWSRRRSGRVGEIAPIHRRDTAATAADPERRQATRPPPNRSRCSTGCARDRTVASPRLY